MQEWIPIDTMANLRAKQNQGRKWTGIDARNTKIADMLSIDVVEPIAVKETNYQICNRGSIE